MSDFKMLIQGLPGADGINSITDVLSLFDGGTLNPILPEFLNALFGKILTEGFANRRYTSAFASLETQAQPFAKFNEDYHVNPAEKSDFDAQDFQAILTRRDADVKSVLLEINWKKRYQVTVDIDKLRQAFTSEAAFSDLINMMLSSLYDGAEIDKFRRQIALVSNLYKNNQINIVQSADVVDDVTAKSLVKKLRKAYLDFQIPSTQNNVWAKLNPGDTPVQTWSPAEDIIVITTTKVMTEVDVETLAGAFHMDKTDLMGRIFTVDKIDADGKVLALIADKRIFRATPKNQVFAPQFFNAGNLTSQAFYHVWFTYGIRAFANGLIVATDLPTVTSEGLRNTDATVAVGETNNIALKVTPAGANDALTAVSGTTAVAASPTITLGADGIYTMPVTGLTTGTTIITVSNAGGVIGTITVNVV